MAEKGIVTVQGRYPREIISTGLFIRDHLLEVLEDYPFHMWQLFKKAKQTGKVGSYQTFCRYIQWLRQLGLITFTREEPSLNPGFKPRRYFTYVPDRVHDEALWRNPRRALHPDSWEKSH